MIGRYLIYSLWQGPLLLLAYLALRRRLLSSRPEVSCRAAAFGIVLLASLPLLTALTAQVTVSFTPTGAADPSLVPVPASMLRLLQRDLTPDLSQLLLVGWLAGVALSLGHVLAGLWRLDRIVSRESVPARPAALPLLAARAGLGWTPEVREWSGAAAPFVAGWYRPVIVLPSRLTGLLSPGELEAVLLHELAHIRRNDAGTNLLLRMIGSLAWYQLPLWKLMGDLARDREHCCDELAVAAMGRSLPLARALLTLAEHRATEPRLVMAGTGGDFDARVRRIVSGTASMGRGIRRGTGLAATLLLAVTGVTLLTAASAEGKLEAWGNGLRAQIQARDPAGPFTVELIGKRLVGATIDGVPVPGERIVQRGERVDLLDQAGQPELTLEVNGPGRIHWQPRPPRSP